MISSQIREPKRPTPQATVPAHAVPRPFTSRVDPGGCREPGGGKIDFGPNGPGHITLEPGETFTLDVDLALLEDLPQPGVYRLSATCHNQDARPSARRVLTSNTIDVQVPAEDWP